MEAFIPKFSEVEMIALIGIFAMGYVFTEFVKRALRHLLNPKKINVWRSDVIWIVSVVASCLVALAAWPAESNWLWWIVGPTCGALNSVGVKLFAMVLQKFSPTAAAAFTGNKQGRGQ